MTEHSSIVGGSTAGRLLNCPGSFQATMALPRSVDVPSEYAEEGTAMHKVMDRLMLMRRSYTGVAHFSPYVAVKYFIGEKFHDRELTQEHIDTMISPALEQLARLEETYQGGFKVLAVEQIVKFPGVPGAFGTTDLILGSDKWVLHIDWKFGQGIGVDAVYKEDGGEKVNPQLMFYLAGAMATSACKPFYRNKRAIAIAIIQPRGERPLTHTAVSRKEVRWFVEDMANAVSLATTHDPPRKRGEHCRFAPCKATCPLWTAAMLDIIELKPLPRTEVVEREITPYALYLARAKALADLAVMFKAEIDSQLHAYLEDGGTVPGWRLKLKEKNRQWVDTKVVIPALQKLGFTPDEIYQTKLQTFASVDATAKRRKVKIPDHLRVAPPTNETTICMTDDPAPAVERKLAVELFAESLKELRRG